MKSLAATVRSRLLLLVALFFAADAVAQVQIVCAPGQAPRPSLGFVINNGIIEFLDNACGNGAELPDPLSYTNLSVVPSSVQAGQSVLLSVNLANYILAPTPDTYDRCDVQVINPNGVQQSAIQVSTLASTLNVTVPFASDTPSGTYTLRLACRRFFSNQEIILPSGPSTTLLVSSNTPPTSCDNLPAPFVSRGVTNYSAAVTGNPATTGFGWPFGGYYGWQTQPLTNNMDAQGNLTQVGVRSFRFVAPANRRASLKFSSTSGNVFGAISTQCGRFDNLSTYCKHNSGGSINWTTFPSEAALRCLLTPGETYYYNISYINRSSYETNGAVVSTCAPTSQYNPCVNGVCTCSYQNGSYALTPRENEPEIAPCTQTACP
jgi:hypothetical protein